jgi:hypothetical protein
MTCDVCGKEAECGVCCVPGVPMSVAYCRECLIANAHPWNVLVANTAVCGGLDQMNEEWREMVFDTCNHLGKPVNQFNVDVAADILKLTEYRKQQFPEQH